MYTTLKLSPPSNTFTISSNSFSNLSKYALLFAFFVSSLYIFIPFHSFQYMRREKKKNVLSTTYSSSATPTDTSFSNLKSSPSSACTPLLFRSYVQSRGVVFTVASACSLFVFKSPFWQSDMSSVFGSLAFTVTGSESDQ